MGPSIQSAINSMISSAGFAVKTAKGIAKDYKSEREQAEKTAIKKQTATAAKQVSPQEMAAQTAMQSASNEQTAKKNQKRKFSEYLAKMPISIGKETGKVGDMPPEIQKKIASTYSNSQRKKIMDAMDKGGNDGKQ